MDGGSTVWVAIVGSLTTIFLVILNRVLGWMDNWVTRLRVTELERKIDGHHNGSHAPKEDLRTELEKLRTEIAALRQHLPPPAEKPPA